MTNERQRVLERARQRQARLHQPTQDSILAFEQELFADEETYVQQLRQAHAATLPPPVEPREELSEFERQHNALRLYIFEQFAQGKKSREIAALIGLSPNKITRWYNQVKDQPPIARLWTPLLSETDVQKWQQRP